MFMLSLSECAHEIYWGYLLYPLDMVYVIILYLLGLMNGQGDRGSISGRVILKNKKKGTWSHFA